MSSDTNADKPKPKFTQTRKGKFVLGVALLIASFWTAYALDMLINPTPPTETFDIVLSDNCKSEVQTRTKDGSLVYIGFECTNQVVDINEVSDALDELQDYATEQGYDINFTPGMASQFYEKFSTRVSIPGDGI